MSNKDDGLPDVFGMMDDENEGESIDSMLQSNSSSNEDETTRQIRRDKNKGKAKVAGIAVGGVAVVALALGVFVAPNILNKNDNKQVVGDGPNQVQIDNGKNNNNGNTDNVSDSSHSADPDFYKKDGLYYPINVNKWQEDSYSSQKEKNSKKLQDDILSWTSELGIGTDSNTLPSEEAGYTSDISKAKLSDGTINPKYSYWTSEVYAGEVGEYVQRLINPDFGGWGTYQYPLGKAGKQFNIGLVSDIFTQNFLAKNAESKFADYIPVYADWDQNNYGMGDQLLNNGPRWYGEIINDESDFKYNDEDGTYIVDYTAKVKFTAWAKDQSKLEKNGELKLTFVSNPDTNNSGHRVLVDNASLKVE